MNAERLHKILIEIYEELDQYEIVDKLNEIKIHLQNLVNQPQQPAHQQNLSKSIKELFSILADVPSNNFSPIWKQIVTEIGAKDILGNNLKIKIETILSQNQITPTNALEEIEEIYEHLEKFKTSIYEIIEGFEYIGIGKEELAPGDCEIGYSIPRDYVKNNLHNLSKEINELNFILSNISEIVYGKREEFKVKAISSSDFLFYVSSSLLFVNILSKIIERIINNYKTILEIKTLRNKLKEKGVPDKNTQSIEDYANSLMEKEIKKLATEIVTEYYNSNDSGRKNELINALIISMNKIANRIDHGFNIEIRVEPLPEPEEENIPKDFKKKSELINSINDKLKNMEFIKTSGKPILKLNESKSK